MVCRAHGLLIVLHDDQGVAEVPQLLERPEELGVVALVEADARLVEDIQHPHQTRSDLGRETDALALAAGQRRRRTGERQIAEAHALQESQTRPDLLEDLAGDHHLLVAQHKLIEERQRPDHR